MASNSPHSNEMERHPDLRTMTLYAVTVEHVAGNMARAPPPVLATF